MINIIRKEDCCGCNACIQKCPQKCIHLIEDEEGFWYPKVDFTKCIGCNLCNKTCPVQNPSEPSKPLNVIAAINPDDNIRTNSSSGGVFSALAEYVIAKGGVVFGAKFNENWEVEHDYCESIDNLKLFRGSKYVQSIIKDQYIKAETFLKKNRLVLFSGTPCQIAALKLYLKKSYNNLITVDIVCHGVPSPLIWRKYLEEIKDNICKNSNHIFNSSEINNFDKNDLKFHEKVQIERVSFRDKQYGWKDYCLSIVITNNDNNAKSKFIFNQKHKQNSYMMGFIRNLYLRLSCHSCKFRSGRSHSDLTLGDYWGIEHVMPEINDDMGVNIILINSPKGHEVLKELNIIKHESTFEQGTHWNKSIVHDSPIPNIRTLFWMDFRKEGLKAIDKSLDKLKPSIISKIKKKIFSFLK